MVLPVAEPLVPVRLFTITLPSILPLWKLSVAKGARTVPWKPMFWIVRFVAW